MSRSSDSVGELVWRGRLHLGSDPGVYGDATYVGLATEWAVTLHNFKVEGAQDPSPEVTFVLEADDVAIYGAAKGHAVTLWLYQPDPAQQFAWMRAPLPIVSGDRLAASPHKIVARVPARGPLRIGINLHVEETIHPGLYDDFVATRIGLIAKTHYASLGFEYESDAPRV
ncbi:MAG: hypothetical protein JNK64_30245 [Myxococcales bacterium]|nr:hypothetical protein [Myxococcales bacterium]